MHMNWDKIKLQNNMKKTKDYIPCIECLPISNLNGHKSYKGMLIHSRTDCPPNTVYMISDKDFEILNKDRYTN